MRLVLYSRCYLLGMLIVLAILLVLTVLLVSTYQARLDTLKDYDRISEAMAELQQQYVMLVSYDWMMALSKHNNMSLAYYTLLYNGAISKYSNSSITTLANKAYPFEFLNKTFYGDVCSYFRNATYC